MATCINGVAIILLVPGVAFKVNAVCELLTSAIGRWPITSTGNARHAYGPSGVTVTTRAGKQDRQIVGLWACSHQQALFAASVTVTRRDQTFVMADAGQRLSWGHKRAHQLTSSTNPEAVITLRR